VADVCGGLAKYKQKKPVSVEEMSESIRTKMRE